MACLDQLQTWLAPTAFFTPQIRFLLLALLLLPLNFQKKLE
jgi:hypothetical protein